MTERTTTLLELRQRHRRHRSRACCPRRHPRWVEQPLGPAPLVCSSRDRRASPSSSLEVEAAEVQVVAAEALVALVRRRLSSPVLLLLLLLQGRPPRAASTASSSSISRLFLLRGPTSLLLPRLLLTLPRVGRGEGSNGSRDKGKVFSRNRAGRRAWRRAAASPHPRPPLLPSLLGPLLLPLMQMLVLLLMMPQMQTQQQQQRRQQQHQSPAPTPAPRSRSGRPTTAPRGATARRRSARGWRRWGSSPAVLLLLAGRKSKRR